MQGSGGEPGKRNAVERVGHSNRGREILIPRFSCFIGFEALGVTNYTVQEGTCGEGLQECRGTCKLAMNARVVHMD